MGTSYPSARIPIHAIWVGSAPPDHLLASLARLQELNPDFEVRLWRDGDFGWLANQDLFDSAPNYAAQSNLARYEIVHREGGFYVDADFEWVRPLDPRYFRSDRLVLGPVRSTLMATGLFGAPAGHPFMARLIANVRQSIASQPGAINQLVSGPDFFTAELNEWLPASGEDYVEIPRDLLYPYFPERPERDSGPWSPQVIGIHHWSQARSRRATSRLHEAGRDAARRLAVKRAVRYARQARLTELPPADRACGRFLLRTLEAADTYIEVGGPALSERAVAMLGANGRVYSLTPAVAGNPRVLRAEGGVDLYAGNPSALGAELDALSHVRTLQIHEPHVPTALAGADALVRSGRTDFVLVPRSAAGEPAIARWCALGATISGLGPTGLPRPRDTGTEWCVLDARPIRRTQAPRDAAGGGAWRRPEAYRGAPKPYNPAPGVRSAGPT